MTTATSLQGTFNFRDTGGMPLVAGGTTTPGVFYRSDALSSLTQTGLEELAASDIGVIVDFRTPSERQMAPDRLPVSRPFRVAELPLLEGAVSGLVQQGLQSAAGGGDPVEQAKSFEVVLAQIPSLGELYVGMLEHGATSFAELARLVANATTTPPTAVLVHCTAGKDRTGVGSALLLDAVGVERSAIVADYTSSGERLAGEWAERMYGMVAQYGLPLTDEIKDLVAATPASAIERALEWVDAHGGSVAYLQSGGLTGAELAALKGRLTGA
ncbi:tyrosine-protein phosphatase [Pseudoclavibacter sp. VKM Ac-2888]|uniref:tyrosine-protein phosphatase n=1 Tax=Pseudoclavibacter sp. VKM Ac-2888 TaxID=2783830 RepID=UPI00188C58F2|nr:tyrosine-protein phosphatase [Pseudoclavibacter sp. VKM Ac-2888]MBF4551144.1 tyrosine-protein phosphatase [Pseudoclavibacter sp. VKM Ac-2888]